jgi:hypothetical protein
MKNKLERFLHFIIFVSKVSLYKMCTAWCSTIVVSQTQGRLLKNTPAYVAKVTRRDKKSFITLAKDKVTLNCSRLIKMESSENKKS